MEVEMISKCFNTEIRSMFGKEYVKVFLANIVDNSTLKDFLHQLKSVKKVNISNEGKDLTIYPAKPYSAKETEMEVKNAIEIFYSEKSNSLSLKDLITVRDKISTFEKSKKLYDDTINNIQHNGSNRTTLDNLRLALELFLQETIGNKCTLEKQKKNLSDYLKSKGATSEIKNSIINSLDSLYHFQNNNVKHDDNIKEHEVGFIIDQTNLIIKQVLAYKAR